MWQESACFWGGVHLSHALEVHFRHLVVWLLLQPKAEEKFPQQILVRQPWMRSHL
ncbi:MAG: hypothetical protein KA250_06695 [Verrucomicrobiales bacterium]|nr:hypothetical protein [Verrucomicrobiales bacterium]